MYQKMKYFKKGYVCIIENQNFFQNIKLKMIQNGTNQTKKSLRAIKSLFISPDYPIIIISNDFSARHLSVLRNELQKHRIQIHFQSSNKKIMHKSSIPQNKYFIVIDDISGKKQLIGEFKQLSQQSYRQFYYPSTSAEQILQEFDRFIGFGKEVNKISEEQERENFSQKEEDERIMKEKNKNSLENRKFIKVKSIFMEGSQDLSQVENKILFVFYSPNESQHYCNYIQKFYETNSENIVLIDSIQSFLKLSFKQNSGQNYLLLGQSTAEKQLLRFYLAKKIFLYGNNPQICSRMAKDTIKYVAFDPNTMDSFLQKQGFFISKGILVKKNLTKLKNEPIFPKVSTDDKKIYEQREQYENQIQQRKSKAFFQGYRSQPTFESNKQAQPNKHYFQIQRMKNPKDKTKVKMVIPPPHIFQEKILIKKDKVRVKNKLEPSQCIKFTERNFKNEISLGKGIKFQNIQRRRYSEIYRQKPNFEKQFENGRAAFKEEKENKNTLSSVIMNKNHVSIFKSRPASNLISKRKKSFRSSSRKDFVKQNSDQVKDHLSLFSKKSEQNNQKVLNQYYTQDSKTRKQSLQRLSLFSNSRRFSSTLYNKTDLPSLSQLEEDLASLNKYSNILFLADMFLPTSKIAEIKTLPERNEAAFKFSSVSLLKEQLDKVAFVFDLVLIFPADLHLPNLSQKNCLFVWESPEMEQEIFMGGGIIKIKKISKLGKFLNKIKQNVQMKRFKANKKQIKYVYYKQFNKAIKNFVGMLANHFGEIDFRKYFGIYDLPTILPRQGNLVLLIIDEVGFEEIQLYCQEQIKQKVQIIKVCIPKSKQFIRLCKRQTSSSPIIWFTERELRDHSFVLNSMKQYLQIC